MSDYDPPVKDIQFALQLAGLDDVLSLDAYAGIDRDMIEQVVTEGGNFARDVLATCNVAGDREGCRVVDKSVQVPEAFPDAYQQFVANGWPALSAPAEHGGMGLPDIVGLAGFEMWNTANMAFALCPMLTGAAANALRAHGSDTLRETYLGRLVSGEWTGTMVLTEPQAGSDLAAITTRAVPEGDHYRLYGTKIYITWGDHPMAENIVHLVLARIEGAPDGIRGISMFLVPKFHVNDDGSIGERNDVYATSVEHKLGIHGSPTCVLNFGDTDGAVGYLVGDENRGMANMFTMMNQARLEVGMQGLAISERAYQLARSYALDRVQGVAPGHEGRVTIVKHADVRRKLLLMKSQIEAMRIAALSMGAEIDRSHYAAGTEDRERAASRVALLTPIIKGWLTETAQELTSLGIQVHGGMGFVEETGAAQYFRDARILPIYEGTTGIQGADLVGRKVLGDEGREIYSMIAEMRETVGLLADAGAEEMSTTLADAVERLDSTVGWLIETAPGDPDAPGAASVNLLLLAGVVIGGWQMGRAYLASVQNEEWDAEFRAAKSQTAKFYCSHVLPRSHGYAQAAIAGTDVVMSMTESQF